MADFASQIVAAKMQELNTRINSRLQEISSQTGIQFSELFASKLNMVSEASEVSGDEALIEGTAQAEEIIDDNTVENTEIVSVYSDLQRNDYDSLISEAAAKYGLDYQLVRALVWAESNFNANAVSSAGAMGLMQLMPATAELLGVTDAFDPEQSINAGAMLLSERIKDYDGDVLMALASYNCGAGGLSSRSITDLTDSEQFSSLPKETQTYLTRIEGYLESLGVTDILNGGT